jgi:hypothetical protein
LGFLNALFFYSPVPYVGTAALESVPSPDDTAVRNHRKREEDSISTPTAQKKERVKDEGLARVRLGMKEKTSEQRKLEKVHIRVCV